MTEYLLTPDELARDARVNRWTIYRLIRQEKLKAKRIGGQLRIRASDAADMLGFWPEKPGKVAAK